MIVVVAFKTIDHASVKQFLKRPMWSPSGLISSPLSLVPLHVGSTLFFPLAAAVRGSLLFSNTVSIISVAGILCSFFWETQPFIYCNNLYVTDGKLFDYIVTKRKRYLDLVPLN